MSDIMLTQRVKDAKIIHRIKIMVGICGILFLLCAVYLFLNRVEIGERYRVRELLSEVTSVSGSSLQLNSVDIDDKAKTFECIYVRKYSSSTDSYNDAREAINIYLKENEDFFLNDEYVIQITIRGNSNGPTLMTISNQNYYANSNELYDNLSYLAFEGSGPSDNNKISSLKNWADIRTLRVWSANMDDISVLSQFTELDYISKHDGFTIHETQTIEQMLPNCKIVSY